MRRLKLIGAAAVLAVCAQHSVLAAECKSAGKVKVVVDLQVPPPQPTAGFKMQLHYPKGVSLPGSGDTKSVKERVSDLPNGFLTSFNDQDGTMSVAFASGTETVTSGKIFALEFDRCEGATAPGANDFRCDIEEAVQDCGEPAGDVHCSVTIP